MLLEKIAMIAAIDFGYLMSYFGLTENGGFEMFIFLAWYLIGIIATLIFMLITMREFNDYHFSGFDYFFLFMISLVGPITLIAWPLAYVIGKVADNCNKGD